MEIKKEYNTIEPNGYNMTTGGKCERHSKASNIKKQLPQKKMNEVSSSQNNKNYTNESDSN